MMTGEIKGELISLLQNMVKEHQERRKAVDEALVNRFMSVRRRDGVFTGLTLLRRCGHWSGPKSSRPVRPLRPSRRRTCRLPQR